jgi:trehalose 6-phosphate synthase/phosphatase
MLDDFAARLPGSMVEEKEFSVAWHYRLGDREFGTWLAQELATTLALQLAGTDLTVLRGRRVVEVRYAWATKAEAYAALTADREDPDVTVAMGDDQTDEELFERLPADAWTIRVGGSRTAARWSIDNSEDALRAVEALATGLEQRTPPTPFRA